MASSAEGEFSTQNDDLKRKSEIQMIYCSICKITLNSSLQANAHFAGKSHNHKAKGLSAEAVNPTLISPTPVISKPQHANCEVCQKKFNSELQLKAHLSGKAHQSVAQSKIYNTASMQQDFTPGLSTPRTHTPRISTPGSFTSGTSIPGSFTTETLTPGIVKTETSHSACEEATTYGMQDSAHEQAQPVGPPTNVGKNLSDLFHCAMCNITLNSVKQLEQHNNGLRHKIIIGEATPPVVNGEKWENVRYTKISNAILGINKDTSTGSGGGMNLREYHCEKCNMTVNSKVQLDQHLESNKHKMKGIKPPASAQNKRKRPAATGQGQGGAGQSQHWNNKRQYTKPVPLTDNFIHGNTYIPGGRGEPVYRLPLSMPKPYYPQNSGLQNWTSDSFGYNNTNVAMF